jgi:GH18 family chitinase
MGELLRFAGAFVSIAAGVAISGCSAVVSLPASSGPVAERSRNTAPARLVGYLPDYHDRYSTYVGKLNFSKMTHLNLAFGLAWSCSGTCTAQSDMSISLQQTDSDIAALVNAAHSAGVKVLISLGGGVKSSDDTISQFYLAGLSAPFAASIAQYVAAHNLDGVDVDVEDAGTMGAPYQTFVQALAAQLHPKGKLLTIATAPYLQKGIPDGTLSNFDFLNITSYTTPALAQNDLNFYTNQKIAANKIVLGVPLFGIDANYTVLENYSTILAAYPNAWQTDSVSGGTLDGGIPLNYVGESSMATETQMGRRYGGVMVWELTQDAVAPHSLMDVIRKNL